METKRICPSCQKTLPPNVPLGLCPECLIKSGFNTGTEPDNPGRQSGFVPPPVEEIRKLFPQFEIMEFIGRGGMGAVYKARQPALDRLVALKILPPGAADDAGFAERFNREARALARLNHPRIVAVHDFGQTGGQPYLVMEFVDGPSLRQVEQAGRLTPEQALEIVPQICEALQFAHNEGVVHRDIKPENILLDKKGRVKITDFGIAKIVGVPSGKASLTGAKDLLGTPHYMAPEQVEQPQTVDHRADIYSLGVVFYELLTGELPLGKFQPPSKKVQVDVRLDEVVLHTLEKEPERRYQHASEVKTDVETISNSPASAAPAVEARPKGLTGWLRRSLILEDTAARWAQLLSFGAALAILVLGVLELPKFDLRPHELFFGVLLVLILTLVMIVAGSLIGAAGKNRLRQGLAPRAAPPVSSADEGVLAMARRAVNAPASWLVATGILNWVLLPVAAVVSVWMVPLEWKSRGWGPLNLSNTAVEIGCVASMILCSFTILAALKMKRLEAYPLAVIGSLLAIVIAPGNLIGLPVGIWSLVVLGRREVRDAFGMSRLSPSPAQPQANRPGGTGKLAAGLIALFLVCLGAVLGFRHLVSLRSDYIGQARFPGGDSIEITSVKRSKTQMVVQGSYDLVSTDRALLALYITSTNQQVRDDERQSKWISMGRGEFKLIHPRPVPGRPHVSMYSAGGAPFAALYFGTREEALEESRMSLGHIQPPLTPAAARNATFGPVIERMVNDLDDQHGDETLNFRTGRLLSLPADFEQGTLQTREAWLNTNGVDLLVDHARDRWALMSRGMSFRDLANEQWETPAMIDFSGTWDSRLLEKREGRDGTFYLLPANVQPPVTFAFATSRGGQGMLQVIGLFTNKPAAMKLRYKLAQLTGGERGGDGLNSADPPAIAPFAQAVPGEFRVAVSNGVTVEVVALTSTPRAGMAWWRPDGTLLAEAPGDRLGDFPGLCPSGKATVEFAVMIDDTGKATSGRERGLTFDPQPQYVASAELYRNNQLTGEVAVVGFRTAPGSLTCKIGFADGEGQRVATWDGAGTLLDNESGGPLQLLRSGADDETCLRLQHQVDLNRFNVRLAARLKNGEHKVARVCRVEYGGAQRAVVCALI